MKRPTFSLRMMLLIVAILAGGLGLRSGVIRRQQDLRNDRVQGLKSSLAEMERVQATLEDTLQNGDPTAKIDAARRLELTKYQIGLTKKLISEPSN